MNGAIWSGWTDHLDVRRYRNIGVICSEGFLACGSLLAIGRMFGESVGM